MGQLVKNVPRTSQQLFWGVSVTEGFDFVSFACLARPEYGFVFLIYFFLTLIYTRFLHGLCAQAYRMKAIWDQLGI